MSKSMIKAILVDDEKHALETLKMLLDLYFPDKFEILAMCNSVDQAVPAIQQHEPDLIFLDIQMPQKNGFTLLEIIPKRNFEVIFTTAYKDHAIPAFKHAAFDYLLKPIDTVELQKTIVRFEEKRKPNAIEETLQSIKKQINSHNIIDLNMQETIEYVDLDDILYLKAEGNYTRFHLEGEKQLLLSKPIGYYKKRFEESNLFVRIHHSFLANSTKFLRYDKKEGFMILRNGEKISVSVRKSTSLNNGFY
ncbi:LytR/AlgR family response regulator transcription factor [Algoriphagus aquimarinus]|uniref:Two component transcriptional regulator, LytTR family n=1 Tax=Algoriphagus aquimarinus TaxID=237018 RepID=A0A1I1C4L7_9BACT|nr:LytTR family DNA-binding domain-containing protein [Algoriphagus aquimarinus]SFB57619.1 two component transcriptional regulator, LytTR family [Algoriphagus aquimarinus]